MNELPSVVALYLMHVAKALESVINEKLNGVQIFNLNDTHQQIMRMIKQYNGSVDRVAHTKLIKTILKEVS